MTPRRSDWRGNRRWRERVTWAARNLYAAPAAIRIVVIVATAFLGLSLINLIYHPNLIEGFFSKLARSVLRHVRVTSKHELRERLMAFISDINREPVVHTWRYKIDDAA
jgi:ABC-type lipoprotein release transport system permease subunit